MTASFSKLPLPKSSWEDLCPLRDWSQICFPSPPHAARDSGLSPRGACSRIWTRIILSLWNAKIIDNGVPVNYSIDVQIQPRVAHNKSSLQHHKDNVEKARGGLQGIVTRSSRLMLKSCYQLQHDEGDVSKCKEYRSRPNHDARMTLMIQGDHGRLWLLDAGQILAFNSWPSVHPMSMGWNDIGCIEGQLLKARIWPASSYSRARLYGPRM